MQKLKQAALANDAPQIVRSAHSLKSSSANVGATLLSRNIFARIEAEHARVQSALCVEIEQLAVDQA